MQDTTTRVDVVVSALVTAWRTGFPDVSVLDGPRAAQALADDVLVVGVGNSDGDEAYASQTDVQDGLSGRLVETITINCELTTWSGDHAAEMAPLRTHLAGILAAIDAGFRADQQLAGTCDRIHLGPRARWYGLQSDDGPGMGVEFSVTAKAYL